MVEKAGQADHELVLALLAAGFAMILEVGAGAKVSGDVVGHTSFLHLDTSRLSSEDVVAELVGCPEAATFLGLSHVVSQSFSRASSERRGVSAIGGSLPTSRDRGCVARRQR